jgi:hypothetical protein
MTGLQLAWLCFSRVKMEMITAIGVTIWTAYQLQSGVATPVRLDIALVTRHFACVCLFVCLYINHSVFLLVFIGSSSEQWISCNFFGVLVYLLMCSGT